MEINEKLELRMYGVVIYQLTPIQAGIQFQHAVTRYSREYDSELYRDWADNWQTSIILNGGTTNTNIDRLGTINKAYHDIITNGIISQYFSEPDLGDQMTAFCLIVDERVFNREKYPDYGFDYDLTTETFVKNANFGLKPTEEWIESIGGPKNLFLRNYLNKLPLWR
jgi:hypothetical protein